MLQYARLADAGVATDFDVATSIKCGMNSSDLLMSSQHDMADSIVDV
ncbi:MAG TPA: hypothetical protein PKH39_17685 [Woeseiaceae bacterium]|nr:hypothetical protein [Woeseiaceae bacterium]